MVDTASGLKEQVKDCRPMQDMQYIKENQSKGNVRDLTSSISQTKRTEPVDARNSEQRRKTILKRRSEMEQVKQKKQYLLLFMKDKTTRQAQYHEQTSKQSNIQTS